MQIDIITLFPAMLTGFLSESMMGRAQEKDLVKIETHDLRKWGEGKWQITDDRPFGGGAGMLLKPEPLCEAIDSVRKKESLTIYLTPDGEPFNHEMAVALSKESHLVLVSGHYEGIDQRVRESRIDREVSIGDYVLTNGTLPAAVLVDAVVRQIPGVLGAEKSLTQDSFQRNVLGFPQYTRPVEFDGMRVPEVLLSGNHKEIERWREERALEKTRERRPDLFSTKDT
ncbi:tRNA (guanosine(37)-N1)-methyltransferase TrmD [Puniceicoccales bacterium CK1056]|uniref:tRNA (guanine-N(1)-)-methyltransferase n=1 Tax=Oceanipulchritudo coccoides TaxID=2706888 RepID=A0A6B2M215_9BACT|nr:tRNA (guanosine(37)-N1)-methyltransferase TrmD [Oceanipulchritudo coccoides]NDV62773.1 tRNA (guanosine(37)-N1)-methyltransferase TrmD [Oceanipulchritudo coccoides]